MFSLGQVCFHLWGWAGLFSLEVVLDRFVFTCGGVGQVCFHLRWGWAGLFSLVVVLDRYGMRYMAKVMRAALVRKFPDAPEKEVLKVRELLTSGHKSCQFRTHFMSCHFKSHISSGQVK